MLGVNNKFPNFKLTGVIGADSKDPFQEISNDTYQGKWLVIFFYPKDFTFICPTEISGFNKLNSEFRERDAQLLGVSIDSEYTHLAWKKSHPDLVNLEFPLLSDIKRELSLALNILDPDSGAAHRATFIVNPKGYINFCEMTNMNVGRNPHETLRVLDALREGCPCPCNWKKGEKTL